MKKQQKVLIAAPVHPVLSEGLREAGYELLMQEDISQAAAAGILRECTGVITSNRLHIGRELLEATDTLRWIGRLGSGMEIIDTVCAAERGVECYSSPGGNANAVAEHALGMLLSLKRHIHTSSREVAEGKWYREPNRGYELEGKTIGIIGFGNTGSAFARKLTGFDMRIMAYDTAAERIFPEHVEKTSLQEIRAQADIISFHVPIKADTRHYFSHEFLAAMGKPFVLINTSRGEVIDAEALLDGLVRGQITGAALDVIAGEPPLPGSPAEALIRRLTARPEVLITPHIAGYSFEALYKMSRILLEKLLQNRGNV